MASRVDFHEGASTIVAAARPPVENVLIYQRIDSTHACALRLIEQVESEEIVLPRTVIIAGEQDQGQGRSDRSWASPPGGLYLSWIATKLDPKVIAQLPRIAAAAACEAVSQLGIDGVVIKWPNDLLVDKRKLAGLLVHARHGAATWVVVSVGVNLGNAPKITDGSSTKATSVADHVREGDTAEWTEAITRVFVEELASGVTAPGKSLATWRDRLVHRPGMEMVVRNGDGSQTRGRFAGLTAEGHLRLDCDGTERVIATGDVVEDERS